MPKIALAQTSMSKISPRTPDTVNIGGAVCQEFKSEAPTAEEMLDRVVCNREQFSFQMCLESGDDSGTFSILRQSVPDSWCHDTECLGLEIDPCRLCHCRGHRPSLTPRIPLQNLRTNCRPTPCP